MWFNTETNKPIPLKDLLEQQFNPLAVKPESLQLICPVSLAIHLDKQVIVYNLERTAVESDPVIKMNRLKSIFSDLMPEV